jgi:hypothetical protein
MTFASDALVRTINGTAWAIATFLCDNCKMPSVGMTLFQNDVRYYGSAAEQLDVAERHLWLPQKGTGKNYDDVPEHIADAGSEAHSCRDTSALRACVLLARSVIEATAKHKGITKGRLIEKIDAMYEAHLIREHIKDGAHEVRHLGNDMAHGDFVEPVSTEDADLVLTLMDEVLEEVFQSPARVMKAKAAREAKKQQSQE